MYSVRLKNGKCFSATSGKTILEAARLAGIHFPYSCKTGRCSSCKCKILSGKTNAIYPELGLSDSEVAENWILSCVREIKSDITLEIDDLNNIEIPNARTLPCRISQINYLTAEIIQIKLRLPPSSDFRFLSGQYIEIIGTNGIRRSYSLANSSITNNEIELHIRKVKNGIMSKYWFEQARLNDLLRLNGPLGTFFLRDVSELHLIFLATGTGIAPIFSILRSLKKISDEQQPSKISVLWGSRHPEDLYLSAADFGDRVHFIPVLSRPPRTWSGAKGYVQNVLLSSKSNFADSAVYACGSENMIHDAKKQLVAFGLSTNHFYSDAFVISGSQ